MSMTLPPDQLHALWNEFLDRWPLSKLESMKLPDYTSVGTDDSFCYWLEARTNELGSIWGGSSFKFGVFKRKDTADKKSQLGRTYTHDYAWYSKYGNTPEEAFSAVREQIVAAAHAARTGDLDAIDRIDLGEAVRWKIAFLYQDQSNLSIAPIYKGELLREITGQPGSAPAQAQRGIMADRDGEEIFPYASRLLRVAEEKMAGKLDAAKALAFLQEADSYSAIKQPTEKVAGFESLSGRQLALVLSGSKVTLFLEPGSWQEAAKGHYTISKVYSAAESRNSNLGSNAPSVSTGHPAISVTIDSLQDLSALCDIYDASESEIPMTNTGTATMPEKEPLNQILYGPPGTGKTYATTEMAVRLAAPQWYEELQRQPVSEPDKREQVKARYDALMDAGQIAFTTFHQSFSYEDFVEGIRAETTEKGQISYDVKDGIFKSLAAVAKVESTGGSTLTESIDVSSRRIWKMSLGNTLKGEDDAYQDCLDNSYIGLGWGDEIDFAGCDTRQAVKDRYSEVTKQDYENTAYNISAVNTFKNVIQEGDLVVVSDGNQKFRAIGEVIGDYRFSPPENDLWFYQTRAVKWLRVFDPSLPKEVLFKKSLSQMTLYELKSGTLKMDKLQELLEKPEPSAGNVRNHVLIIDEINRGNISRIFGELITLLEPDKREGGSDARSVSLPYSKDPFSVPQNLYVLGTMNTADRSLAQIDLALRRRFEFIELQPAPELLQGITVHGVDMAELLDVINQRIEVMLDREHTIGHAYFWPLRGADSDEERAEILASIFEKRVIPLLQEYFFSDWERIGWVLNDPAKPESARFIQMGKKCRPVGDLFPAPVAGEIQDRRYRINSAAFTNPAAYQGILPGEAVEPA